MSLPSVFNLNEHQRQAVELVPGPVLVIAGAGSGKTRVITARIAHIITGLGADPESVVALTFTNKAAKEMRERVMRQTGDTQRAPFIGTFHAYCVRLLKIFGDRIGIGNFSILDGDDQITLIKKLLEKNEQKTITARQALYEISRRKNNPVLAQLEQNWVVNDLAAAYEHEKTLSNCLDFDDLLIKTLTLLKDPVVRAFIYNRVRHVLVDEYQDTNVIQHELLKSLALRDGVMALDSLCVVGDEDQSIYSWRGATVDNVVHFKKTFAGTTIVKLEQNYRSARSIVTAAHEVIQNNENRHDKYLWSDKEGSQAVGLLSCTSNYQEADIVAHVAHLARVHRPEVRIGVLYRTHAQSRVLEEALIKKRAPYILVGGVQFYERKEIKDILAYARLLANPRDRVAFMRVINCPSRSLGDAFVELFLQEWGKQPFLTFVELAAYLGKNKLLKPRQQDSLDKFVGLFVGLTANEPAADILETLIKRTGYESYLKDVYDPSEANERLENINELCNAAAYFMSNGAETLELFLQEVSLMQEHDRTEKKDAQIHLMTIHAAKGLEFDYVIIVGLQDGVLPNAKSLENASDLEEERRLMYVAMTRAKEKLLLLQPEIRYAYGSMMPGEPSRFLDELPKQGIQKEKLRSGVDGAAYVWLAQFFACQSETTFFGAYPYAK